MKLIVATFQDAESLVKVLSKYYYTRMIEIKDDLGRTQCW